MPNLNDLSERELEILYRLAEGESNKEIAEGLFISTNTVKVHLRNIFSKLEVSSRTEAILYVLRPDANVLAENKEVSTTLEPTLEEAEIYSPTSNPLLENGNQSGLNSLQKNHPVSTTGLTRFPLTWSSPWVILLVLFIATLLVFIGAGINRMFQPEPTPLPNGVDISSSATNLWESKALLPYVASGQAATIYEDEIYIIGGENTDGVLGNLARYNPEMDQWAILTSKPTPVADIQAIVIGGKFYIPGGRLQSGQTTNILEIYDPREDSWFLGAEMPMALSAYAMVPFEGQLYLFGGWNGQEFVDNVWEYNPEQDEWHPLTSMKHRRGFLGAAVVRGKIFVFGGYDGSNYLTANEIYIPENDQAGQNPWSEGTPLPEGRAAMGVATVTDVIHLIGGEGQDTTSFSQIEYSLQNDAWLISKNPLAEPWSHMGVVSIGTQLYAIGGKLSNQPTDRNLAYQVIFYLNIPVIR